MKTRLLGTVVATIVVALAGMLGWAVSPDDVTVTWLVEQFAALDGSVQVGVLVAVSIALAVPWIAPYTAWTGDDWAIKYQSPVRQIFSAVWNAVAGNFGNAANQNGNHIRDSYRGQKG